MKSLLIFTMITLAQIGLASLTRAEDGKQVDSADSVNSRRPCWLSKTCHSRPVITAGKPPLPLKASKNHLNLPLYRIVDTLQGKRAGELRSFAAQRIKMRWCPPGTFKMGSPASDEDADDDEQPQITVRLTRGYWLGQSEVTQVLWERVMGTTPWSGERYVKEGANYPASYVDWDDAVSFFRKLTERERASGRLLGTICCSLLKTNRIASHGNRKNKFKQSLCSPNPQ